jgi:hypothetical protein
MIWQLAELAELGSSRPSSAIMPEGWQWDPTLFRGSAAYSDRSRLPYAPGFADLLAGRWGFHGQGQFVLPLAGVGPGWDH